MEKEIKAGWKTTEFGKGVAGVIVGVLIAMGILTPDHIMTLSDTAVAIAHAAEVIAGAVTTVGSIASYAISRGKAKQQVGITLEDVMAIMDSITDDNKS